MLCYGPDATASGVYTTVSLSPPASSAASSGARSARLAKPMASCSTRYFTKQTIALQGEITVLQSNSLLYKVHSVSCTRRCRSLRPPARPPPARDPRGWRSQCHPAPRASASCIVALQKLCFCKATRVGTKYTLCTNTRCVVSPCPPSRSVSRAVSSGARSARLAKPMASCPTRFPLTFWGSTLKDRLLLPKARGARM